ncbi:hypothetical protein QFZ43_005135 [Streptomyces afghaniensis]|nr:hypothetical protein [Streptomyces afghaniensis]
MGHRARESRRHALHREHAGRVQPQGVAREGVGRQGHQALLLDEARAEADRGQRDGGCREREGRVQEEGQVRGGQEQQEGVAEAGAQARWDQAAHQDVPGQHAERRAGEQGAGGVGGVGDVEGFAADDQAVRDPQGQIDPAAGCGRPEQGVGAPRRRHRGAAGRTGRAAGQAEADDRGRQDVEGGRRQQGDPRGQQGHERAAGRVSGDLHEAAHHVEHRAAQQIAVLGEDLVQQAPAHSPAHRLRQSHGQDDREEGPDR